MTLKISSAKAKDLASVYPSNMPSPAWFALSSLEGFTSAKKVLDTKRVKGKFKQLAPDVEGHCWMCGGDLHHPVNDGYCQTYKPKTKFNDHWECKGKDDKEPLQCVACEALANAAYHPNFKQNALYTPKKAYQLTLDEDLISFFINPPVPPYLFVMGESNSQHMCWLGQYTLDNDLMAITKGRVSSLVSRTLALEIAFELKAMLDLANQIRNILGAKQSLSTPLLSSRMDINKKHGTNLQLSKSIYTAAREHDNDDNDELKQLRLKLSALVTTYENKPMCYLTWYVATMFFKAINSDFKVKPSAQWKLIQQPTIKK